MSDTRIVPFERESSLWPSTIDRSNWNRELLDLDRNWREMDEWMEKVWKDSPFWRESPFWKDGRYDIDFFRPSEMMNRMREQIDRLMREAGFDDMVRDFRDMTITEFPRMDRDHFGVSVDVRGFEPYEVKATVKDNNILTLQGDHEERSSDGKRYVSRKFMRQYTMPEDVDVDRLRSTLGWDGRTLKVEAPRKGIRPAISYSRETPIPITRGDGSTERKEVTWKDNY